MDSSKLRNSCVCGNSLPYLECCGVYCEKPIEPIPIRNTSVSKETAYQLYRYRLHELFIALLSLREFYQSYWESLAEEDFPVETLMDDPDFGRAIIESFFWDYFTKYSESRPILRIARHVEGDDLKAANDYITWSMSPLWAYRIDQITPAGVLVRNLGNDKMHLLHPQSVPPNLEAGMGLITRIVPFQGYEFCASSALVFPKEEGLSFLRSEFKLACQELGVKPGVALRPDVHTREWSHHSSLLRRIWRRYHYDRILGRPHQKPLKPLRLEFWVKDSENIHKRLSGASGIRILKNNRFEHRFRYLKVSEITLFETALVSVLSDFSFESYFCQWLHRELGDTLPEEVWVPFDRSEKKLASNETLPGENPDQWLKTNRLDLNGQSPLEAATHDFGRRRLRELLEQFEKQGSNTEYLRKQLQL